MTYLLSKYPLNYVKKILQKLQKFISLSNIFPNIFYLSLYYRSQKNSHHNCFYYDGCYIFNFIIFFIIPENESSYSLSPLYAFR